MTNSNSESEFQDYIEKESDRFATANTYILNNPFLNQSEKLEVELWFQFPSTALFITFCICVICNVFYPLSLIIIIALPIIVDYILGVINWHFKLKRFLKIFFLTIGHKYVLWILTLFIIVILIYYKYYIYSVVVFVGKLGLSTLVSPSLWTYTIWSRKYKMHTKYAYFKRWYGFEFPFEQEIEEPNLS